MIRRHFLMSKSPDLNSVIKYTTSDGSLFDLQGILDFWISLYESNNIKISLGASVTSNTYSDVGLIVLNTIIDKTSYFEDALTLFPIFTTSIFNSGIDFTKLTSIELPDTITLIGTTTFLGCTGLQSVILPKQVEIIGANSFSNCTSLTSITIPNSVINIGEKAFDGCSSLTSVTIPNSVTSIGADAFRGCSAINSIVWNVKNCADFPSSNTPFYDCRSNINSFTFGESVEYIPAYLCDCMDKLVSITIPNSVLSIGLSAFKSCSSLTSITIGNSVTSIGLSVFYGCSSLPIENNLRYADTYLVEAVDKTLSTYSIKNGTKWIGSNAFSECSSLTSITIPNSVTSIGWSAFSGCSSLTSVTIPNSVTSIEYEAFYDSWKKDIFFLGTIEDWCKISLQNGLGGYDLYLNGIKAEDIVIPDTITTIDNYKFKGCNSLTSVTIPNSVTSIGDEAFSSCSSLTSVTIPLSVVSIGLHGFSYSKLNSINFNGTSNLWLLITKGNYWNNGIPATVVHCTDGDVTL